MWETATQQRRNIDIFPPILSSTEIDTIMWFIVHNKTATKYEEKVYKITHSNNITFGNIVRGTPL